MAELINPGAGPGEGRDGPKIHIDSDWKAEAQRERERLAETERTQQDAPGAPGRMPEADLLAIVRMLATQAILYMGGMPDPETGRAVVAPEYARYHIDLLGALEKKTRGNRSEEEERELAGLLHELRLRFVDIMGAVDEAMARRGETGDAGAGEPG